MILITFNSSTERSTWDDIVNCSFVWCRVLVVRRVLGDWL